MDRAHLDPAADQLAELFDVVGDPASDAAQRERRTDDGREANVIDCGEGLVQRAAVVAARDVTADLAHRVAKEKPILGELDRLDRGADQLDAVFLEGAVLPKRDRQVQCRLTANGGQEGVRPLALDDLGEHFGSERLYIRPVGDLRVGHDRRRIAVDEHDLEALSLECLAGLSAGVVEF